MGPVAEPVVLRRLGDDDRNVRYEACQILMQIGTEASLEKLEIAARDKDIRLASTAKLAIQRIRRR
jgi:HEAT repeat protein